MEEMEQAPKDEKCQWCNADGEWWGGDGWFCLKHYQEYQAELQIMKACGK